MLETARTDACVGSLQECSSIGRAPVSKTGGRRFEPCHSCHSFNDLREFRRRLPGRRMARACAPRVGYFDGFSVVLPALMLSVQPSNWLFGSTVAARQWSRTAPL